MSLRERARDIGLPHRPFESDDALRARLRSFLETRPSGSLSSIDYAVSMMLPEVMPVYASEDEVKRGLAIFWLRKRQPSGFFAKLRWVWEIARTVWRRAK